MKLKAELILDVYEKLQYDVVNIGRYDLALGRDELTSLIKGRQIDFVSSNLYDKKEGKLYASPYKILENKAGKIGVIGVMTPDIEESYFKLDENFEIKEPVESVKEYVEKLKDKIDIIIVLSSLGEKLSIKLVKEVEGIDIIIGGGEGEKEESFIRRYTKSIIVKSEKGGKQVGVLKYKLNRPGAKLKDGAQIDITEKQMAEVDARIARIRNKEDKTLPKRILKNKKALEEVIKVLERQKLPFKRKLDSFAKVNWYVNKRTYLRVNKVEEDEETRNQITEFYAVIAEYEKNRKPSKKRKDTKTSYRKVDYCKGCHKAEYDFWKTTKHSSAYESLERIGRNYDPDCFGCHTTGYNYPGGFYQANEVGDFKNVQCEMCHPVSEKHITAKKSKSSTKLIDGYCFVCHIGDYGAGSQMDYYLKRINCKLHAKKGDEKK